MITSNEIMPALKKYFEEKPINSILGFISALITIFSISGQNYLLNIYINYANDIIPLNSLLFFIFLFIFILIGIDIPYWIHNNFNSIECKKTSSELNIEANLNQQISLNVPGILINKKDINTYNVEFDLEKDGINEKLENAESYTIIMKKPKWLNFSFVPDENEEDPLYIFDELTSKLFCLIQKYNVNETVLKLEFKVETWKESEKFEKLGQVELFFLFGDYMPKNMIKKLLISIKRRILGDKKSEEEILGKIIKRKKYILTEKIFSYTIKIT